MYSCALLFTRPETPPSRVLEADVETYDKVGVKIAGVAFGGGNPYIYICIYIYIYIYIYVCVSILTAISL